MLVSIYQLVSFFLPSLRAVRVADDKLKSNVKRCSIFLIRAINRSREETDLEQFKLIRVIVVKVGYFSASRIPTLIADQR